MSDFTNHTPTPTPTPTEDRPKIAPASEDTFPNIQSGRYKFISVIGHGGAGTVYRALDSLLAKEVAIKRLHIASDDQTIRFQREARLAGTLKHENVMKVLDFGITEKNEPYLIIDYVDGESLGHYIRHTDLIPIEDALNILIQIANGLNHAHNNGVIHRDIKPSNVILIKQMVRRDNSDRTSKSTDDNESQEDASVTLTAKIVDFGLAKSNYDQQSTLTQAGTGLGTPKYMSPEHIRGIEIDERSDIYSLGCLIFEVLTGRVPFQGTTVLEVFDKHLQDEPPRLARYREDCSDNLELIVSRCLQKKSKDRFQTARDLADHLRKELKDLEKTKSRNDDEISEASGHNIGTPSAVLRDQKLLTFLGIFLILSAVTGSVYFIQNSSNRSEEEKPKQMKPLIVSNSLPGYSEERIHEDLDESHSYSKGNEKHATWSTSDDTTDQDMIEFLKKNEKRNNQIVSFDLSFAKLGRAGFQALADQTNLKALQYINRPIDRESLENIALIKTITDLRLGTKEQSDIGADALDELAKLKQLKSLYIGCTPLNDRAFEAISHLQGLRFLELSGCTNLSAEGSKHLSKLKNLEYLKLDMTDATDSAIFPLLKLEKLTQLHIRQTRVTNKLVERLPESKNLNIVDLRDNPKVTRAAVKRVKVNSSNGTISIDFGTSGLKDF